MRKTTCVKRQNRRICNFPFIVHSKLGIEIKNDRKRNVVTFQSEVESRRDASCTSGVAILHNNRTNPRWKTTEWWAGNHNKNTNHRKKFYEGRTVFYAFNSEYGNLKQIDRWWNHPNIGYTVFIQTQPQTMLIVSINLI